MNEFLDQKGLSQSEVDCSLFYIKDVGGAIILMLSVDDLLLTSSNRARLQYIKWQRMQKFVISDLGDAMFCF